MFGMSHIEFEWMSDRAQALLHAAVWLVLFTATIGAFVVLWYALALALGL
jgi:hypothetical protein